MFYFDMELTASGMYLRKTASQGTIVGFKKFSSAGAYGALL
jgi:hypothetical protein